MWFIKKTLRDRLLKQIKILRKLGPIPFDYYLKKYDLDEITASDQEIFNDMMKVHRAHLDNPKLYNDIIQDIYLLKKDIELIRDNKKSIKSNNKVEEIKSANDIILKLEKLLKDEAEETIIKNHPPKVKIKFRTKTEYYWHAGLTGVNGENIDSILKKGLLPKKSILGIGNDDTFNKNASYVANDGKGALHYLKSTSEGYNWRVGGLPFIVCIEVKNLDKSYSFDTDITKSADNELQMGPLMNGLAWFALILTYNTVQEFIDAEIPSSEADELKKDLVHYSSKETDSAQHEIWKIILNKNRAFLERSRLESFKKIVAVKRWNLFLRILNNLKISKNIDVAGISWQRNLLKLGGWDKSHIKRMYIISPNKDKHWKQWALIMPADKNHLINWEKWNEMKGTNGVSFPGKGKLLRIY